MNLHHADVQRLWSRNKHIYPKKIHLLLMTIDDACIFLELLLLLQYLENNSQLWWENVSICKIKSPWCSVSNRLITLYITCVRTNLIKTHYNDILNRENCTQRKPIHVISASWLMWVCLFIKLTLSSNGLWWIFIGNFMELWLCNGALRWY